MPLDINGYNDTFKAFVDFAQGRANVNDGKTIIGAKIVAPLDERRVLRRLDTVRNDSVHNLLRDVGQFEVNNATRRLFRQSIADMFGGESKIPASVKKAMLMRDYGCGKPLTVRRILAVKAAIDADGTVRALAARAKAEVEAAADNIGAALEVALNTPEERGSAVDVIMRSIGTDRDLLAVLQANDCNALRGLALDITNHLRTEDKIAERIEAIRQNIDELRVAAKGNGRMFEAGIKQLTNFGGKALRSGTITKMCDAARKVDIGAFRKVSAEASTGTILTAVCRLHKGVWDIYGKSDVKSQFEVIGGDEINGIVSLSMSLIYARCDNKTLRGLREGLLSVNSAKVQLAINRIGRSSKVKDVKDVALALCGLFWRNAVGVLNDTIGDNAHLVEPDLFNTHYDMSRKEFDEINRILEAHVPQVSV